DLRSLASEVVKQYGQAASLKNVSLVLDGPAVIVRSDRSSLMLALRNLVSNAIKFSNPGAPVRVEVSSAAGSAQVSVADKGVGIPADKLEEVFHADGTFRRAGTAGEISNGLGLAVSRSLVESLGGRITVQSTPGQGSIFTIVIPSSDND
ncbi:MAG: HAMP domain-containing histidine kinase, partial [Bacteroidales bacterium]|nr:HAMP domain-containing histidine kinase [Bacteroidales bacterium]